MYTYLPKQHMVLSDKRPKRYLRLWFIGNPVISSSSRTALTLQIKAHCWRMELNCYSTIVVINLLMISWSDRPHFIKVSMSFTWLNCENLFPRIQWGQSTITAVKIDGCSGYCQYLLLFLKNCNMTKTLFQIS